MSDLRIAVLGVGMMGADHVARITGRISNARVAVVNDYLAERAERVAASVPGARVAPTRSTPSPTATSMRCCWPRPGPTHEKQLVACLEHGKPVLCEKPLTTDVVTSLEVVEREAELGKPLIQVGFMRRFDPEYAAAEGADRRWRARPASGHALRAPQPHVPAGLRLRDDRQGLAGA